MNTQNPPTATPTQIPDGDIDARRAHAEGGALTLDDPARIA